MILCLSCMIRYVNETLKDLIKPSTAFGLMLSGAVVACVNNKVSCPCKK